MEVIIAVDKNYGIGFENQLPWCNKEELRHFKNLTLNSKLIVGVNTAMTLPRLQNRQVYCIVESDKNLEELCQKSKNSLCFVSGFEEVQKEKTQKIFVAGGAKTYRKAMKQKGLVDVVHLSVMAIEYTCDTYFDPGLLKDFVIEKEEDYQTFMYYKLKRVPSGEEQYLELLQKILDKGNLNQTRNGITKSLFVEHLEFNLLHGFPLLTTKKMFFRGIVEEFLFFVRGNTNANILASKKVNIWKKNTTKEFLASRGLNYAEGVMGPMYGYQWRNFGAAYKTDGKGFPEKSIGGCDQFSNIVELIQNDPHSRRIIMTTFNPVQADEGVLYPCHSICVQFYVKGNYLDMFCFNRSQDTFLGVPYNIASSALLLHSVAKICKKIPRFLKISMGDTHLYENHFSQAKEQIGRIPYKFPQLDLPELNTVEDLENCSFKDFKLDKYFSHATIAAEMVA